MKKQKTVVMAVSDYVVSLLKDRLPAAITFHNLHHTLEVFEAVKIIGEYDRLSLEEMEIVQIAALFHDTGYLYTYRNHEDESIRLAKIFLQQQHYLERKITAVTACIVATKVPQRPLNLTQQVLCDADLYHLSLPDYDQRALKLRKEWEYYLDRRYSDSEWKRLNCNFIVRHSYFTDYGKTILQKGKQINPEQIQADCD